MELMKIIGSYSKIISDKYVNLARYEQSVMKNAKLS